MEREDLRSFAPSTTDQRSEFTGQRRVPEMPFAADRWRWNLTRCADELFFAEQTGPSDGRFPPQLAPLAAKAIDGSHRRSIALPIPTAEKTGTLLD